MPKVNTTAKQRQAADRRAKKCTIQPSDIFTMTDAFFSPSYGDSEGWVFMAANYNGMAYVNALFPGAPIKWDNSSEGMPDGWSTADINVPGIIMAAAIEHTLPMDITKGMPLENITADGLAFLLVTGVNRQGGRAGFMNLENDVKIFVPNAGN